MSSCARRAGGIAAALLALLAADVAVACRCAPRPLEAYLAEAELAFLAHVDAVRVVPGEPPHRLVDFTMQRAPFKGPETTVLATPLSSASCGVPAAAGEIYLVFATRHAPGAALAWFDSCNGTRRLVDGERFAPPFEGLTTAEALARLAAAAGPPALHLPTAAPGTGAAPQAVLPLPGDPHAQLVGLLELPALPNPVGSASTPRAPRELALRAQPQADAPVMARVDALAALETRESSYEQPAAVVRERRPQWYRLALRDGRSGWLAAADAGAFHALPDLVVNRLNYLTAEWDGWLWPSPGAGYPLTAPRAGRPGEQPARVLGSEVIGDTLWWQVEVLDRSPCDGPGERVAQAGWIPAYTPAGALTAWYHSRGC